MKTDQSVIVIGGGAAGFFAAINCAKEGLKVTLLEKTGKLLSKVRVSGGGRCNVTHACYDNGLLVKNYPRGEKELRGPFSKFSAKDTVAWFAEQGVQLKTEEDGRMFPVSDNSETIISCFMSLADKYGVRVLTGVNITSIECESDSFRLTAEGGGEFICSHLIIATGGSPKPEGYNIVRALGHTVSAPTPSLFTFNIPDNPVTKLMGVSVPFARVRITGTQLSTEGPLLITHWGLSGPAVLKASAWGARLLSDKGYHFTALINWIPKLTEEKLRIIFNDQKDDNGASNVLSAVPVELPRRLWEHLCSKSGISESLRWADLSKKQMNVLIHQLLNDEYEVRGKTTFKEEFVTCGGVSLKEIDMSSMQSKLHHRLYFAGEVIDVDGITGGFNFQNAWTGAWIASQHIIASALK